MDNNQLFVAIFFSIVGIGFYAFGKKNNVIIQIAGALLMIFPYFVSTVLWQVIIGVFIMVSSFVLVLIR